VYVFRTRLPVAIKLLLVHAAPRLACIKPAASVHPEPTLNRVVLPAPLGPIRPTTLFDLTSIFTLSKAFNPPKLTDRELIASKLFSLTRVDSRHTWADSGDNLIIYCVSCLSPFIYCVLTATTITKNNYLIPSFCSRGDT